MRKFTALLIFATLSFCLQAAELPVVLGSAVVNFSVLAHETVTSTGPTIVYGDVGLSPGSSVTGFPPGLVVGGAIHATDVPAANAQAALLVAYNDAAGRSTAPITVSGNLAGRTLAPGLYKSTSSLLIDGGVLTLDGGGNANSVFIFQMASTLTTGTGSEVRLTGGAQAANIFWQVGSSATLGTYSIFNGTILAFTSITLNTGAALNGRALALNGAVNLDTNTMVNPGPPTTGQPPAALAVACPSSAAQVGVPYSSLMVATGGTPPYTYSITGSLPPGLSPNASTGAITGTPTGLGGTSSFSANVLDSVSGTAARSCSITTSPSSGAALAVACPSSAAQVGVPYSSLMVGTGGTPPYTYSITGSLPPGLSPNASTGAITGTPTGLGGTSSFSANALDSVQGTAARSCSIITAARSAPPPIPAPSSVILVAIGLACVALYQGRERLLRYLRNI